MSDRVKRNTDRRHIGLERVRKVEEDLEDLKDDVNDLRKQNSATHDRIFTQIQELDKDRAITAVRYDGIIKELTTLSESAEKVTSSNRESIEHLSAMVSHVDDLEKLANDINEIRLKPAKRYEDIVKQVIGIIVGAIAALVLTKIGLSV